MKQRFTQASQQHLYLTRLIFVLWFGLFGALSAAQADIRLPHVFGSHMVLQQEKPLIIWGWANPGETVKVQLGAENQITQANQQGEWKVVLPAMKAGGPYTLTVSGSNTATYDDVLIGEVWLCSGQSNMEFGLARNHGDIFPKEIAAANHPNIRLLFVGKHWKAEPQDDIEGAWKICTSKSIVEGGWQKQGFSAVAYFFGRELHQKLQVPIGLIESAWGGTRIEPWTPPEGFASVPVLKNEYERVQLVDPQSKLHRKHLEQTLNEFQNWLQSARQALDENGLVPPVPQYPTELLAPHDLQQATVLYNGMIHPLIPFQIRGVIWYQGEQNESDGMIYASRMEALINGWRQLWNEGNFPFYFVQIAPYNYGNKPEKLAELWAAQTLAANTIPNTGMAVINDIGNLKNIHPTDKTDVGHRLALLALAKTYGYTNLIYSGPTFKSMQIEGDDLRVTFNHVGDGLKSRDGKPLDWFQIIGTNGSGFVKANARIDGDSVILSAPGVNHPVAMRFAWSGLAEPNLVNSAALPASAFRAGQMPKGN